MAASSDAGSTGPTAATFRLTEYLAPYAGNTPPNDNSGGTFSFYANPANTNNPFSFALLNTAVAISDTEHNDSSGEPHAIYGLSYNDRTPQFAYNDEATEFVHDAVSSKA